MIYCSIVSFSTQDSLYFYQNHDQTNHIHVYTATIFCRMKSAVKFLVIILHCGRQPSASKKCFYTIFSIVLYPLYIYNRIHKRCVKMYKCNDCNTVFCLQYQCHEQAWYRRGGGSSDAACSSGQSLPAILAQNTG